MWKASLYSLIGVLCVAEACTYRNRECAEYVVKETHPDYEVRSYPALTWVTASEESSYFKIAMMQSKAFRRLFKYISGENDRNLKIEMTVPVRMKASEQNGVSSIQMSFLVPAVYAANPPKPNDQNITVSFEEPIEYAVRTFSGYVWRQGIWDTEAETLAKSVGNDESVDKTWFYQVGYDSPFQLFNRRNEIWMHKTAQEETNEI